MSIVVGIDPSAASRPRQVALNRTVGGWKVVGAGASAHPNRVVLSVPSELLTFRNLTLPFSDRRRAQDIARQELANSLPMPIDDVVWSLCPISRHEFLAVISPRKKLETLKAQSPVQPDVVDAEPFAWSRALAAAGLKMGIVVCATSNRTTFCVIQNSRPNYVRVLLRGTDGATDLKAFVNRLVADAVLPDLPPDVAVFVTGEASVVPGFMEALRAAVKRETKPFPVPDGVSSETDVSALGAALRSVYPDDGVDLYHQAPSAQPEWVRWMAVAAVVLLLLTADVWMHLHVANQQEAVVRRQIQAQLRQVPPRGFADVKALKDQVDALTKQETAGSGRSVLDVMKLINQEGARTKVKLTRFAVSDNRVHVQGVAPSFTVITEFQKALQPSFPDVTIEDSSQSVDNFHFSMGFQLGGKP
ncbi:MAG: hypothetical protein ACYCW6_18615 [Candidatus Xenobia bacterium]